MGIFESTREGDLERLQEYIELGGRINVYNPVYCSLLHSAVYTNQKEIVRYLCQNGAKKYTKNKHNQTPLDVAIKLKHTEICNILKGQ